MGGNKLKFGLLASRSGSNASRVIKAVENGAIPGRISFIVGVDCYLEFQNYIKQKGIDCEFVSSGDFDNRFELEEAISIALAPARPDVLVSCSFSKILSSNFIQEHPFVINSHPSLLPAFIGRTEMGKKPVDAALEYGVRFVGATVHFIDKTADQGPPIIQGATAVPQDVERDAMIDEVLEIEERIKVQALAWYAEGKITLSGREVKIERPSRAEEVAIDGRHFFSPSLDKGY